MTATVAHQESVVVLGGGSTGVAIVERVLGDHDTVVFLDPDPGAVECAVDLGATAELVDVTSGQALEAANSAVNAIERGIVVAETDATALLVGQLAKTKLDVTTVLVLMNDSQNRVAFETAGMTPVCTTSVLADAVVATHSLLLLCDQELSPGLTVPPSTIAPPRRGRRV